MSTILLLFFGIVHTNETYLVGPRIKRTWTSCVRTTGFYGMKMTMLKTHGTLRAAVVTISVHKGVNYTGLGAVEPLFYDHPLFPEILFVKERGLENTG